MEAAPDIVGLATAVRDLADRVEGQQWPRWLDVPTASRYCSIGQKSIRNLIAAGKINPSRTVRGKILIDRLELDSAMLAGCGARPRKGRGFELAKRHNECAAQD